MNAPVSIYVAESRPYKADPSVTFYEVAEYRNGKKEFNLQTEDSFEAAEIKAAEQNVKELAACNPVIGSTGTELHYTDRVPVTVTRISKSGKKVWVRINKCEMIKKPVIIAGGFAGVCTETAEWNILDEFEEGEEKCYTYRKNGTWVREGDSMNGARVTFHYQYKFYDYNF